MRNTNHLKNLSNLNTFSDGKLSMFNNVSNQSAQFDLANLQKSLMTTTAQQFDQTKWNTIVTQEIDDASKFLNEKQRI